MRARLHWIYFIHFSDHELMAFSTESHHNLCLFLCRSFTTRDLPCLYSVGHTLTAVTTSYLSQNWLRKLILLNVLCHIFLRWPIDSRQLISSWVSWGSWTTRSLQPPRLYKPVGIKLSGAERVRFFLWTTSILWLLMPWLLASPSQQQPQYNRVPL